MGNFNSFLGNQLLQNDSSYIVSFTNFNLTLLPVEDLMTKHFGGNIIEAMLGILGFIFNILAIVGLKAKNDRLQGSDFLLLSLAVWDAFFTGSRSIQFATFSLYSICTSAKMKHVVFYVNMILYSANKIALTASMLLTVFIAADRVKTIFLKKYKISAISANGYLRAHIITIQTIVITTLLFFPELLVYICVADAYPNNTMLLDQETVTPICKASSFFGYIVASMVIGLSFSAIAWIVNTVFNTIMIVHLYRVRKRFKIINADMAYSRNFHENGLTAAIIGLVMVDLFAYSALSISGVVIYARHGIEGFAGLLPQKYSLMRDSVGIIQIVNSSLNFFFYLCFGGRFRRKLLGKCSCLS